MQNASMPFIEFYREAQMDNEASQTAGYRVTKDVNMVRVIPKGGSLIVEKKPEDWIQQLRNKAINQAHDAYPLDWINQIEGAYKAWKDGLESPVNGSPVKEWGYLSPAQVQNLTALRLLSIEDVADMTEEAMGRYGMGARILKDKAKEYLEGKKIADYAIKENEELKKQVAELQEQMAELLKPKPGRPRKET